jgi:hypothetical protein
MGKYLLEYAPEDEASIRKMCNDMRKSALLEPFATPLSRETNRIYFHPAQNDAVVECHSQIWTNDLRRVFRHIESEEREAEVGSL